MNKAQVTEFQQLLRSFYTDFGRHDMLWRQPEADGAYDPYKIMVSEVMLQQTQVARVHIKYQAFLARFPDVASLAKAPLADVLGAWSGLGYNRRAKFLWLAAQQLAGEHKGNFPTTITELSRLPGIGPNTAGAICAYAFNQPVVFIETNIRTVFIHHFLRDQTGVSDSDIQELVTKTLPEAEVREWYWALMDYGTYLKNTVGNLNRESKSYAKQSTFKGSLREVRGKVLRLLIEKPRTKEEIVHHITDTRLPKVLDALVQEQLIRLQSGRYHLG